MVHLVQEPVTKAWTAGLVPLGRGRHLLDGLGMSVDQRATRSPRSGIERG